jgi:prepilin-type N-terminal cleavage/methylation domain-containing protein
MSEHCPKKFRAFQTGFSLLEVAIVLLILSVIMGAVFSQINLVQQRSSAEQSKLDMFQESREFMDQMSRDLRLAGYPNIRNVDPSTAFSINPIANDGKNAVGIVKVDTNELWLEGDVDGDGSVESVQYHYDTTGSGCPCLKRSQVPKTAGTPLSQGNNFQTEVQNVVANTINGSTTSQVFWALTADGANVALPVDFVANPTTIASINTIQVVLTVQSKSVDLKTRQPLTTVLTSTVKLNNCSQAAASLPMSCQ